MADVCVDLPVEGWPAEAQAQAGACQIIQQFRRGYTRYVLAVGVGLTTASRRAGASSRIVWRVRHCPFLVSPKVPKNVVDSSPAPTASHPARPAAGRAAPLANLPSRSVGTATAKQHHEDACAVKDGQQRGFEPMEVVVEGGELVAGMYSDYSTPARCVTNIYPSLATSFLNQNPVVAEPILHLKRDFLSWMIPDSPGNILFASISEPSRKGIKPKRIITDQRTKHAGFHNYQNGSEI